MARTRPPPAFFDFSPFQDAPGVAKQMRLYGAPQIVDIPQTSIPSPLAPDLAPDTIAKLKRRLVGDGSGKGGLRGESGGAEVWASWKRAWDLWNNHYIEGRVSPVWIREEYERLKKEMGDARDRRRRDEQMNRFRHRHQPKRRITPTARATIFSKDQPKAAPGKVFKQTTETRPSKNVVVKKMQSRPKPGSTRVFKRKGDVVPVYGERFVTEIVQVERVVSRDPIQVSSWTDLIANSEAKLPLPEGNAGPESMEIVTEITLEERQVMDFGHVDVLGDKVSPKVMSYKELIDYMKSNDSLPGKDEETDPKIRFVSQRPQMWYPVTEPCLDGERTLTVDETVPIIEFEDQLVDVLEEDDKGVLIGWAEEDEDAAMDDSDDHDVDLDLDRAGNFGVLPVVDEEPAVYYKPKHLVERDDGFSGGFFPMKCLDPYPEPDDPDGDGSDPRWLDALQNTVWRPRHVGEKTLRIEMDDVFDDVTTKKWLEVDGGLDCGRSPYPVLRSVTEYVKIPKDFGDLQGLFRKKKMWDGVTGTIFNMPTKPLEQDETEDERVSRMQALYGDIFRDNRGQHRHDFFPLDIRRVKRRDDKNYPGRQFTTPVLESNETLVRYPWHIPEDDGEDLPPHDPWAVTAEQKQKRNIPVRRHPPAQCCKGKNHLDLLPVDDSIWREELQDDDYGRWKYYVTNLHGGTLLINGKEVKKNQIAGPLPEFAVIECPGKQVAFWWGPGGRNYLQGVAGYDYEGRWESLRRSDPELEKVALTAGQEWDYKIRVRITKEFSGNEWSDDEQWEEWKKAVAAPEPDPKCDPARPARIDNAPITLKKFNEAGIPTGTDVVQPECFQTDRDELKWLHTKAEPLSRAIEDAKTNNFIEPIQVGKKFFPGAKAPPKLPEIAAQNKAIRAYNARERDIVKEQQKLNASVAKEKADRAEREREVSRAVGRKREADSLLQGPFPKKTLADLKREAREAEEDLRRQVETTTQRDKSKIPQTLEALIRVFDKDVRAALERKVKEYEKRKAAALAAGHSLTDAEPTLEDEIEQYLNKRREKEQLGAKVLQQLKANRIAAGGAVLAATDLPPGVDEIYTAWKDDQGQKIKVLEGKAAAERRKEEARQKINRAAEQERLKKAKAAGDAACKRSIEEEKMAAEKVAAEAKMTPAERAREKRLANWRAIIATNKAKKAARSKLAEEAANKSKAGQQTSQSSNRSTTSYIPGGSESLDEQAALLADIEARSKKRRADLEENIAIRAQTAGQTVESFVKDQGFASKEAYISSLLRHDSVTSPPVPPTPSTGPSDGLIRTQRPPPTQGISLSTLTRLIQARKDMRGALARGLKARAAFEKKTEQQVVRSMGYYDVSAYLANNSNSILSSDIPSDTPSQGQAHRYPPALPANATQAERDARQAQIAAIDCRRRVDAASENVDAEKRKKLMQRIVDAENFELVVQTLERRNPPRLDVYSEVAERRTGEGGETSLTL